MKREQEARKTILAIDDDADILYTIEQIGQFQGWRMLTAQSQEVALAVIRTETPDLIIVDYHMPGMGGVGIVKQIRRTMSRVPILVLTVEERDSVMERFMSAGATDYALKPIKAVDLISRIKVHLNYCERSSYYENVEKGISKLTLQTLADYLKREKRFLDMEQIEKGTGMKQKTLYRYLKYLSEDHKIELKYQYRDTGRPKTLYCWRDLT